MTQTTRRTVVRGAAWTAPLIVVGAAAPAFATSVPVLPKPKMTLCKIGHTKKHGDWNSWLLNFTFTFTGAANSFTIPNNTILLDNQPSTVTITQKSATVWQVRTVAAVDVAGLSGTVKFNYSVNGSASTAFSQSYNTGGNYCPVGT